MRFLAAVLGGGGAHRWLLAMVKGDAPCGERGGKKKATRFSPLPLGPPGVGVCGENRGRFSPLAIAMYVPV